MDRKGFFDSVRNGPFPGALNQKQVDGMNAILDEWDKRELTELSWLAYMLATAYHETAHTMQPIAEFGHGKGHKYGEPVNGKIYYGRGYVQLTWDFNYKKMGTLLGVDLLDDPDLAMQPDIAAAILFEGMIRGSFTGKKLSDFLGNGKRDFFNARTIVNGHDRAQDIAGYANKFFDAVNAASESA
jgi:putative chitinase